MALPSAVTTTTTEQSPPSSRSKTATTATADENCESSTSTTSISSSSVCSSSSMTPTHAAFQSSSSNTGRNTTHAASNIKIAPSLLEISETNKLFKTATTYTVVAWIVLVCFLYTVTPAEELQYLSDAERWAAAVAFFSLATATLLLVSPFAMQQRLGQMGPLLWAAFAVQIMAMLTNGLLAFCPVMVRVDAITWSPVYLIRWTEWIPTSGLMTFLCEAVAIQENQKNKTNGIRAAAYASLAQSLSCLMGGLVCAYCTNVYCWCISMSISVATYACIFPRVVRKRNDLLSMKFHRGATYTYMQHEKHDRLKFSYHIMLTCATVWSVLVVLYVINAFIHRFLPFDHPWREHAPAMVADTLFDVLAKAFYMRCIVDVHFSVFDSEARSVRQLSELRGLMTILWDSSSDVIVISLKGEDGKLLSILSPSFLDLLDVAMPECLQDRNAIALMVELAPKDPDGAHNDGCDDENEDLRVTKAQFIDTTEAPYRGWVHHTVLEKVDKTGVTATIARSFIMEAWKRSKVAPSSSFCDMKEISMRPYTFQTAKAGKRKSEIKTSRHGTDAIIGVIRDVTERYRWFEAEQRAHAEVIRRQKDAQSQTRFVRHEVKNGLLAGIELCDALRNEIDAIQQEYRKLARHEKSSEHVHEKPLEEIDDSTRTEAPTDSTDNLCRHIFTSRSRVSDLDLLLHEALETVLYEAMARDVIHEVYKPRVERLDVQAVLSSSVSTKSGKSNRLPIQCIGDIPFLQADSQLLRYIHRNAISNAIKYGKSGGNVDTILSFDTKENLLKVEVINEKGDNHDEIRKLSKEEYNKIVFSQGLSLHDNSRCGAISSGDGAWIMQKCAKTMGGSCSISFEEENTTFTFVAPAEPLVVTEISNAKEFEVPSSTVGIAIDDSKIQRKLMARILTYLGISPNRSRVIGTTPSEVMELKDIVTHLLQENPESNVLILIDENLDYGIEDGGEHIALSGSVIMQGILDELEPEQERRVLALVRSANDSTADVARYTERTHGFFPKAPMQKDRVREIIAPLWAERFLTGKG